MNIYSENKTNQHKTGKQIRQFWRKTVETGENIP